MNESRESKNAEQLEELLLLTEEIQAELEQKDQLIVELKTQLNESLTLNEKLNKENRALNIQSLKNDLKMADRALRIEKEKLRSANVTIEDCQDKIRCLTQERDYARTHQKIVEIPVEKPVLYEKCEACDRAAYQNAKTKYETQKERLAGQYKAKTVMFQTTLFLLAWYSLISTLFQAIQSDAFLSDCKSFFNDLASFIQTFVGWTIDAGHSAAQISTKIPICKSFFSKVLKLLVFQGVWMFLCSQFPLFFPLPEKNKGKSYCTLSSSFAASRLASLLACA